MEIRSILESRVNRRTLVAATGAAAVSFPLAGRLGAHAQDSIVATMVTDTAGIGDESFNDLAKAGGDRAADELGVDFEVLESNTAADYVRNLTDAASTSDIVIAVGFLLTDALTEVAAQFPDVSFTIIDSVVDAPNVLSFVFAEQEGAFLGGVLCALTTKTNQLGYVGGVNIPPVKRYEVGYIAGVRSINPDIQVATAYAETFEDPDLGKELSLAQYKQGADIILAAAGRTGIGTFDAAKEAGAGNYVLAADQDQSELGAEFQIAAVIKGIDTGVYDAIKAVQDGTFQGGTQTLKISNGGMGIGAINDVVPQETRDIVQMYSDAIAAGTVMPPTDDETLKSFVPVPPEQLSGGSPVASPMASPMATPEG